MAVPIVGPEHNPSTILLIREICARLPEGVIVDVGSEHLTEAKAPPRVLWVPVDDVCGTPENTNGGPKRMVCGIVEKWQCYLFVKGDPETQEGDTGLASLLAMETFKNRLITEIYAVCRGNVASIDGQWSQQDNSLLSKYGRSYVLNVSFHNGLYPFTDDWTLADIDTATISPFNLNKTDAGEVSAHKEAVNGDS